MTTIDPADSPGWGRVAQEDVLAWVRERWPAYTAPIWRAAKLGEEAGEVLGAVIKSQEGVGGKGLIDVAQETAQVVLCAMALAESCGFDLAHEVEVEWERCLVRTWPVLSSDDSEAGRS